MKLANELKKINSIFIDTAPIIYYIEANPNFGLLSKEVVDLFQNTNLAAFSSVLTITEVLSKPIETDNKKLVQKFLNFLKYGKNFNLIEITSDIAEIAANLKAKYTALKTIDSIQIACAVVNNLDAFLTNDKRLKTVKDIKILVLKDFL